MATTLHIQATINQHIAYLKPAPGRILADYLRYFIDSAYDRLRSESDGAGSTKGAITIEQLSNIRIPLPAIEKQRAAVVYLDSATARIDTLIAKTERSIELLREHRIALITAAVAGKIDLRNAV
jgi:type I restriction enzyme S subunit